MQKAISLYSTATYHQLVEDVRAIHTERRYNAQTEIISCYAEIGERIYTDLNYKKHGKGNEKFIIQLAKDTGISARNLYYALAYHLSLKQVQGTNYNLTKDEPLLEGKNISWNKIKKNLTTPESVKEHECDFNQNYVRCCICGKFERIT